MLEKMTKGLGYIISCPCACMVCPSRTRYLTANHADHADNQNLWQAPRQLQAIS